MTMTRKLALVTSGLTLASLALGLPVNAETILADSPSKGVEVLQGETAETLETTEATEVDSAEVTDGVEPAGMVDQPAQPDAAMTETPEVMDEPSESVEGMTDPPETLDDAAKAAKMTEGS